MENLEQKCLEKLNNILSKFDLKIDIVNIQSNLKYHLEYHLVDNSLPDWCMSWLSISDILIYKQSIFDRMKVYHDAVNSSNFSYIELSDVQLSRFQIYSKIYQSIQSLKSSCLEEFLIRCDLTGI